MASVPPGGPAATYGLLYQALWCTLHLTRFRSTAEAGAPWLNSRHALILEPADGGDVQEHTVGGRRVVQLKASSAQRAWSLKSLIADVLPGLFKATTPDGPPSEFWLVTEGRMGGWSEVLRWFGKLGPCPRRGLLKRLDNAPRFTVNLSGGKATRRSRQCSPRQLFEHIAEHLRVDSSTDSDAAHYRRVWRLLSGFTAHWGISKVSVETELKTRLHNDVEHREHFDTALGGLVADMLSLAAQGSQLVDCDSLLSKHGFSSVAGANLPLLLERNRKLVEERVTRCGFDPTLHVQPDFTDLLVGRLAEKPVLLLTGAGGSGKSWHGLALAHRLASDGEFVVHAEAGHTASETLDDAASVLWNQVKEHDASLSFAVVAARFPGPPPPRTVVLDRVDELELARALVLKAQAARHIRLVLCCGKHVAESLPPLLDSSQLSIEDAPAFSASELDDYLQRRRVSSIVALPPHVRELLAQPLMARLYCDTNDRSLPPATEYELLDRYWRQKIVGTRPDGAVFDIAGLHRLAGGLLDGQPYPWLPGFTAASLQSHDTLERLVKAGCVRALEHGTVMLWHDRLLNWLLAHMLCDRALSDASSLTQVSDLVAKSLRGEMILAGRRMEHIGEDLLWLFSKRGQSSTAASILSRLEETFRPDKLYEPLIAELGASLVPAVVLRLEQTLEEPPKPKAAGQPREIAIDVDNPAEAMGALREATRPGLTTSLVRCLSRAGGARVVELAERLLGSDVRSRQAMAVDILAEHGSPSTLDRLWELHCLRGTSPADVVEHRSRMKAMERGIRLDSGWLLRRLNQSTAATKCVSDLVYLLARFPELEPEWMRLKAHLKQVVPKEKWRCLLLCIDAFRDHDETEFLSAAVASQEDLQGPMALATLSRLNPDMALDALAASKEPLLGMTRGWHFHLLLAALPEATRSRMTNRFHADLGTAIGLYSGAENQVDVKTFDAVLDALEMAARHELAAGSTPDASSGRIMTFAGFADRACRPELLERLRQPDRGDLAETLCDYLLAIGPRPSMSARMNDAHVMRLLEAMASLRAAEVIAAGLRGPSWFGQIDAAGDAHKHANDEVVRLLGERACSNGSDRAAFVVYECMKALCLLDRWELLIPLVVERGLEVGPYLFEHRCGADALPASLAASPLELLANGDRRPGVLLAIGLCGGAGAVPAIERVLAEPGLNAKVALSAAIALDTLSSAPAEAVSRLASFLNEDSIRDKLASCLASMGSSEAVRGLADFLNRGFHPLVCAMLAAVEDPTGEARRLAARQAWTHRTRIGGSAHAANLLRALPASGESDLVSFLCEHAQDSWGSRGHEAIAALEALIEVDPERGFREISRVLETPAVGSHPDLPALLMKADPTRGEARLLERLRLTNDELDELALLDALDDRELSPQILAYLSSTDARERRVGVLLASRRRRDAAVTEQLRTLTLQEERPAAMGIVRALWEIDRSVAVSALTDAVLDAGSRSPRWVLLDLLAWHARGTKDRPTTPRWAYSRLDSANLTPLECERFNEAIRKGTRDYESGAKWRHERRKDD